MEAHNFTIMAYNGTIWLPVVISDLKRDLDRLTGLDFIGLKSKLSACNNALIADATIEAVAACGYPRPILENLLLVRREAVQVLTDSGIVFSLSA
jgi:hypothetical protein